MTPVSAAAEETIEVRSPLYTARLSNEGGVLKSFVLTQHRDGAGKALDLVRQGAPFPGATLTLDPADAFLARAAKARFAVERESGNGVTTVRFRYREASGEGLVRTYVFRDSYVVAVKAEREGAAGPVGLVLGPGIGNPSAEELSKPLHEAGRDDHAQRDGLGRPQGEGRAEGRRGQGRGPRRRRPRGQLLPHRIPSLREREPSRCGPWRSRRARRAPTASPRRRRRERGRPVGAGRRLDGRLPRPEGARRPREDAPRHGPLIDYGWYAILVKPLLWGLKAIHKVVGNWGVAILLITVVIKVLLYPLTHKQLVSMKKMSVLQPKVETIRAKWSGKVKQDPQARVKMNEEMMALYKQEGVNPAGGCLPLLLQMPILIAFYNLLAHSIELRHAPFMLWITDLSSKDPYYVTPILMTATMWLQQQMTPTGGDPTMRRVQNIMPLVMGFLFKDVPSGLVLYWLMQNVLTIGQQMLLNKFTDLGPTSMKPKAA